MQCVVSVKISCQVNRLSYVYDFSMNRSQTKSFYIEDPLLFCPAIKAWMVSYVDDCTIVSSGVNINEVSTKITLHLANINDFLQERNL